MNKDLELLTRVIDEKSAKILDANDKDVYKRQTPLWSQILPIRNAKHRQNPVTVCGHEMPVDCNA